MLSTVIASLLSSISIIIASFFQYNKLIKAKNANDIKAVSTGFWLLIAIASIYSFAHLIDVQAHYFIIIAKGIGALLALILLLKIITIKFTKSMYILIPVIFLSILLIGAIVIIQAPTYIQIISIVYIMIAYLYQSYKISKLKTSCGVSSAAFLITTLSNVLIVITLVIDNVEMYALISQCISALMAFTLYKVCLIYAPKNEHSDVSSND